MRNLNSNQIQTLALVSLSVKFVYIKQYRCEPLCPTSSPKSARSFPPSPEPSHHRSEPADQLTLLGRVRLDSRRSRRYGSSTQGGPPTFAGGVDVENEGSRALPAPPGFARYQPLKRRRRRKVWGKFEKSNAQLAQSL